jgi:hypothetical protein
MIRHRWKLLLSLLLSLVFLVIVAVLIRDWAVETPAEQLDQKIAQLDHKIQLKPTPAYNEVSEEFSVSNDGDTGQSCSVDYCYMVRTEPTNAVKLASITKEVLAVGSSDVGSSGAVSVEFYDNSMDDIFSGPGIPIGTSFCFDNKDEVVSTLGEDLGKAKLLGTIDYCYIAVYKPPALDLDLD